MDVRVVGVHALVFGTLALRAPVPVDRWDTSQSPHNIFVMEGKVNLNPSKIISHSVER